VSKASAELRLSALAVFTRAFRLRGGVRYDSIRHLHEQIASQYMNGQLSEYPLAELIREISVAGLSGALRLERERVKVVIYFDKGHLCYATSNLRLHRLAEVLVRSGAISEQHLGLTERSKSNDAEMEAQLAQRGTINSETLDRVRSIQVSDILSTALLWTSGTWLFDGRARVAGDIRVELDSEPLMMEAARHLPEDFITFHLGNTDEVFAPSARDMNGANLSPVEAFVLSRVQEPTTLSQLTALSGVAETEALRAIYALALGGLLERRAWPSALPANVAKQVVSSTRMDKTKSAAIIDPRRDDTETEPVRDNARELDAFFVRLGHARDHFEVLDIGRGASPVEVKHAYHALARRFHPDRFHQSDSALRARVESAFARVAQAYETLSDSSSRAAYQAKLIAKPNSGPGNSVSRSEISSHDAEPDLPASNSDRAAAAFEKGLKAQKQNQYDAAVSCFAEAAHLVPREARYRAQYGQALAERKQTRRLADTELRAAVSFEPQNASYRIMLAELYQNLGLRRRAQAELERALMAEPKNKTARAMLASLQEKG